MVRKYLLPTAALGGFIFAINVVRTANVRPAAADPVVAPARSEFLNSISGAGMIEASSENVEIGAHVAGVVEEVLAPVGTRIRRGAPLFRLDGRTARAEVTMKRAALEQARADLRRLESSPRAEDIPPFEARVAAARASLEDARSSLLFGESVRTISGISTEQIDRRRFAVKEAEARVAEAESELARIKAGAWTAEVDVAKARVESAAADLASAETRLALLTVESPIDGEVLQVNIQPGEFAQAGALSRPLMIVGSIERLHVRVDIDENDAWRFTADAAAKAVLRGNTSLSTALSYVRVEPFVVPKRSLTGASNERVDTRVMQVIYSFDRKALPVFVGQQVDVFIEAKALPDLVARAQAGS